MVEGSQPFFVYFLGLDGPLQIHDVGVLFLFLLVGVGWFELESDVSKSLVLGLLLVLLFFGLLLSHFPIIFEIGYTDINHSPFLQ